MTRLVPRPDWTPEQFVRAVLAIIALEMWTTEAMATHPAVLALFRPAEEPIPVAPPQAEERKEWPPKRPKPVALIPTPTCSEERDPWGNAESRVRTLAHEANNEAGADVAIHLFRAAHDAALAALRSELSASQREVERLRRELEIVTCRATPGRCTCGVHVSETMDGSSVPSGENRSEG